MAGRRNNGAGHIRQKPDGRWEALYYVSGERRYITGKKGETASDVQKRLNEALHNLDRGIETPKDNRQTVGEWMDTWLAIKKANKEYSYWKRCEAVTRLYIKPAFGRTPLTKLTAQQIEQLYAYVTSLGRKPNTVKKVHIALHAALAHAVRQGLVVRNVADLVDKPSDDDPKEMKTYTPEQVQHLFEAAQGHRFEALFVLYPTTGCRLGELLGLRWSALDLERGELHVVSAMKDVAGHQWMGTPKTPRSRRIVPLTTMAVEALRRHHVNQTVERLKHGAGWNPDNLVFCTSHGTAFSQTNMRKYYVRFLNEARLPFIRQHDHRHTFGSTHLKAGTPVHEVQALMGHTSPTTTLGFYAHVMPGSRDQNRTTIERAYGSNPGK